MKVTIEQAMRELKRSSSQIYLAIRKGRIKKFEDGMLCGTSVLRYRRDYMRNVDNSMTSHLASLGLTPQQLADASGFTTMTLDNFYNNRARNRRKAFDLMVKGLLA